MPEASASERLLQLKQRWDRDPNSRLFLQLAEEYRRAGRLREAIATLSQGLERHPSYLSAQVAMGRCLLEAGDADASAEWLERAIRQDPTQLVANKLLVETHLAQGDAGGARERLDIYRLLNDGDAEIEQLERRLHRMDASALKEADSAPPPALPLADAEPFELSRWTAPPPIELALPPRLPRESAVSRDADPFGALFAGGVENAILRAFEVSGIFEVERAPEPPAPPASTAAAVPEPLPEASAEVQPVAAPPVGPEQALEAWIAEAPEPREEWTLPQAPAAVELAEIPSEIPSEIPPEPPAPAPAALFSPRQAIGAELEQAEAEAPPTLEPAEVVALPETHAADADRTSTTLGELYLAQGHLDEAERSFLAVLAKRPEDAAAAAGLEATRRRRRSVEEEFADVAEPGMEPPAVPGRSAARKIAVLRNYLARLRRGA